MATSAELDQTEQWFLRRGIPHFIADYSAGRDVLTRAVPLLGLIFFAGLFTAVESEWTLQRNAAAVAVGAAVLATVWIVANLLRKQRAFAYPTHVGSIELAVVIVGPALPPLIFGGQVRASLLAFVVNATLVAVVYLGSSYGALPMIRWAFGRLVAQGTAVFRLFARALPVLLFFVVVLLLTGEVWLQAGLLSSVRMILTVALLIGIGVVFLAARIPKELRDLDTFDNADELAQLAASAPIHPQSVASVAPSALGPSSVGRKEWGNVVLVLLVSQALQVSVVALTMFGFVVVFGVVAIGPDTVTAYLGGVEPDVVASLMLFGERFELTLELLEVATFLAVLSGLFFTITSVTDAAYREEFRTEVTGEIREAFAVRRIYRELHAAQTT